MWRQRLNAIWLVEGDKNTKYFHNKATQGRKKNWIKGVKTLQVAGKWRREGM